MYKYTDYLPSYLRGSVKEIEVLGDAIDPSAQSAQEHMTQAYINQFISRCDEETLRRRERLFNISADPENESLEFRRKRLINRYCMRVPFTMNFLRRRLDEIIGKGMYKAYVTYGDWHTRLGSWRLGESPFRDEPYTLHIEAATESAGWYHEVHVLVNKIKPANIVFSFSPMVPQAMEMSETVAFYRKTWNYRLGAWRLGAAPFMHESKMEVVKVPEASSINPVFLNEHARISANMVMAVKLNKSLVINNLQKSIEDGAVTIRYTGKGINEINVIELLGDGDTVLTGCGVYIPIPEGDQVVIRHILLHKEGIANG